MGWWSWVGSTYYPYYSSAQGSMMAQTVRTLSYKSGYYRPSYPQIDPKTVRTAMVVTVKGPGHLTKHVRSR